MGGIKLLSLHAGKYKLRDKLPLNNVVEGTVLLALPGDKGIQPGSAKKDEHQRGFLLEMPAQGCSRLMDNEDRALPPGSLPGDLTICV